MYKDRHYYVYIVTNFEQTVLYTGVTNDLKRRLREHCENVAFGKQRPFTGRYNCHYLVYWEHFTSIRQAIDREKEIKGWRRSKKERLIITMNPEWKFLNDEIAMW